MRSLYAHPKATEIEKALILEEFYKGGENGDRAISIRLDLHYEVVRRVINDEIKRLEDIMRSRGHMK